MRLVFILFLILFSVLIYRQVEERGKDQAERAAIINLLCFSETLTISKQISRALASVSSTNTNNENERLNIEENLVRLKLAPIIEDEIPRDSREYAGLQAIGQKGPEYRNVFTAKVASEVKIACPTVVKGNAGHVRAGVRYSLLYFRKISNIK